jgi:hypothetical protein
MVMSSLYRRNCRVSDKTPRSKPTPTLSKSQLETAEGPPIARRPAATVGLAEPPRCTRSWLRAGRPTRRPGGHGDVRQGGVGYRAPRIQTHAPRFSFPAPILRRSRAVAYAHRPSIAGRKSAQWPGFCCRPPPDYPGVSHPASRQHRESPLSVTPLQNHREGRHDGSVLLTDHFRPLTNQSTKVD